MPVALRHRLLMALALTGLGVAILAALENRIPAIAAFCGFFGQGCQETGRFTLLGLPVTLWGIGYYAALILALWKARPAVFWLVVAGFGVEATLMWTLVTLKLDCVFCLLNFLVLVLLLVPTLEKDRLWQAAAVILLFFTGSFHLFAAENRTGPDPAAAMAQTRSDVVARVGDRTLTVEDLESPLANRIYQMQQQIYQLKQERLDALIDRMIMENEAAETGTSLEELTRAVKARAVQVTDADVARYHEENQQRMAAWQGSRAALMSQIRGFLQNRENDRTLTEYASPLREKYGVTVFLKAPPLPFTVIAEGDSPALGPADAPVTVIEFSDYLCPACRATHKTIQKVREHYQGRIRWVFKDFPLEMHPGAKRLAEAARCADDQGAFWAYQDLLFDAKDKPDEARIREYAERLGLDAARFAACLDSGRHLAAIEADIESAVTAGVGATPTFIINGRLRPGAPSFETFKELIDAALARSAP